MPTQQTYGNTFSIILAKIPRISALLLYKKQTNNWSCFPHHLRRLHNHGLACLSITNSPSIIIEEVIKNSIEEINFILMSSKTNNLNIATRGGCLETNDKSLHGQAYFFF